MAQRMPNFPNRLFDNLAAKKVSIGGIVTMSDLTVSELAGDCGLDFVWIDAEHCPHTIEGVMKHLIAIRGTGCAGLVRVRECDPMLIKPYLDLAPDGIICPMVNTPELAEAAVAACRYPKTGIRGCGVRRAVRWRVGFLRLCEGIRALADGHLSDRARRCGEESRQDS